MSWWIPARELSITWAHDPNYWKWTRHDSCSSEVAELLNVCWLDISGEVDARNLQVMTSYSAFLVFKLKDSKSRHLEKATASLRFLNNETTDTVFIGTKPLDDDGREDGRFLTHLRSDGWSEIKLGEFFNNSGDDGGVDMQLFERDDFKWKSGLIVRGIDVRPNTNNSNSDSRIWFECPDIDDAKKINNHVVSPTTTTTTHVKTRMSIIVLLSLMFFLLSVAFFG